MTYKSLFQRDFRSKLSIDSWSDLGCSSVAVILFNDRLNRVHVRGDFRRLTTKTTSLKVERIKKVDLSLPFESFATFMLGSNSW